MQTLEEIVKNVRDLPTLPTIYTALCELVQNPRSTADDMAADFLLEPAVILPAAHRVAFHLGGALHVLCIEVHVILRVEVLAQRDTAALAV